MGSRCIYIFWRSVVFLAWVLSWLWGCMGQVATSCANLHLTFRSNGRLTAAAELKRWAATMKYPLALLTALAFGSLPTIAQSASSTSTPSMEENKYAPDPPLTKEQQEFVDGLSPEEIERIDQALIANCAHYWRKVARVVGASMGTLHGRVVGIPDLYYAQRVAKLVSENRLEAQGNLQFMRFSEVRLPTK